MPLILGVQWFFPLLIFSREAVNLSVMKDEAKFERIGILLPESGCSLIMA